MAAKAAPRCKSYDHWDFWMAVATGLVTGFLLTAMMKALGHPE